FEAVVNADEDVVILPAPGGAAAFAPVSIVSSASPTFLEIIAQTMPLPGGTIPGGSAPGPKPEDGYSTSIYIPRSLPRPPSNVVLVHLYTIIDEADLISLVSGPE